MGPTPAAVNARGPQLPTRADLVVIGAGICGCACAVEAARRGAAVLVVEKEGTVAPEGSGRSFGSLRVHGRHPAELPLAMSALDLWARAARDLEDDFEFVQGGNLYVAERDDEVELLRTHLQHARDAGLEDVRLLTPAQVRDLLPGWAGRIVAGLYSPRDAHCNPGKAVAAYARAAIRHGAVFAVRTRALGIEAINGAAEAVVTDRGAVRTRAVVVAAGVWTPALLAPLGVSIPIKTLIYSNAESSGVPPLFRATVRAASYSCRQRPDGKVVFGAGLNARVGHLVSLEDLRTLRLWLPRYWAYRQQVALRVDVRQVAREVRGALRGGAPQIPVGLEPVPDRMLLDRAFAALQARIPPLADAAVTRRWAGFIDLSPDGLPVVDRVRPDGVTLAAGLSGHGLALGPALGTILADLALEGHTRHEITAFRLARFTAGPVPLPRRLI
ncbi:MAG: FAD-dependent oxidoreductase [Armatimonadota bacterium]|nr:FAD-dependent oxidoreductase [Armatimonadota bacterium]MDR7487163.1 FAD-dependent oxidoreductase [Armatimonadota bacterium]MDR7535013.1 FAD-dependent oxidoreductase [Armatimonadota bacterium]